MFSRKLRIGEIFEKVLQSWSCTLQKERYNKSASGCRDTERENNMNETYITTELLAQYAQQLYEEEKSSATIEKYIRDVRSFSKYAGSQALTKDLTIAYKRDLPTRGYTILSVNSMLASLNSFLVFCGTRRSMAHLRRRWSQWAAQKRSGGSARWGTSGRLPSTREPARRNAAAPSAQGERRRRGAERIRMVRSVLRSLRFETGKSCKENSAHLCGFYIDI